MHQTDDSFTSNVYSFANFFNSQLETFKEEILERVIFQKSLTCVYYIIGINYLKIAMICKGFILFWKITCIIYVYADIAYYELINIVQRITIISDITVLNLWLLKVYGDLFWFSEYFYLVRSNTHEKKKFDLGESRNVSFIWVRKNELIHINIILCLDFRHRRTIFGCQFPRLICRCPIT